MTKTKDTISDAELLRAIGAGQREAYEILVDRYLPSVYAVVSRILCNSADAEDVTQETFMRAFERLSLFHSECSFRNWLLKIGTNLAFNCIRTRRRQRVLLLNAANVEAKQAKPADELLSPREWQHWIAQLDEAQRAAIVLFHFHGMPYAEISEVLEVPVNTVRTLLHRGRKRLRELLSPNVYPENGSWNVAIQNG